jgi:hypothetical protein
VGSSSPLLDVSHEQRSLLIMCACGA